VYHGSSSLPVDIPDDLVTLPRWILWDLTPTAGGRPTKRPRGSTRRGPWLTLDAALTEWRGSGAGWTPGVASTTEHGVGLVMTDGITLPGGGHVFCLDLDGCRVPESGELAPWALEVVRTFRSYTEPSPSGTGLRIIGYTSQELPTLRVIDVGVPVVAGDHRRAEIQLFGSGGATYVTVTGRPLPGSPSSLVDATESLRWLQTAYPESVAPKPSDVVLPGPVGRVPMVTELEDVVRASASPDEKVLIDEGDWAGVGLPSASEGWWLLCRHVLGQCANHVDVAVEYLLTRTAYGRGDVVSKDPGRYCSPRWVRADLLRCAGKLRLEVERVFQPLPVKEGRPTRSEGQRSSFDRLPTLETYTKNGADPLGNGTHPTALEFPASRWATAEELLTAGFSPEWLVKGFLERDTLAVLAGAPGSYKTFLAIDLALAVARGAAWHGHRVRQSPVLLVAGEGHGGFRRRFRAWCAIHDVSTLAGIPVAVSRHRVPFLDAKAFDRMELDAEMLARAYGAPPGLIIIDTLNRNMGPGDENSTEDMTRFLMLCDRLRRRFRKSTVLIVHHVGHGEGTRPRGSSVLGATVDAEIIITRLRDKRSGRPKRTARVVFRKMKDAEEPQPFFVVPQLVHLGVDDDGDPVTSLAIHSLAKDEDTPQVLQLQAVVDAVLSRVHTDDFTNRKEIIGALPDFDPSLVNAAVTWASEGGFMTVTGSTRDRVYKLTPSGVERVRQFVHTFGQDADEAFPDVDEDAPADDDPVEGDVALRVEDLFG
jgi:hypothetical protein